MHFKGKRQQAVVMTKVCTHGRGKEVAMQQLEESLRRLQTDHLDLWQIHEVIYENDPDLIFAPAARPKRCCRPSNRAKCEPSDSPATRIPASISGCSPTNFPFDTVQMPLNCLDATFRSFETNVLPEARKQGIAVLGMKSMGGSGEIIIHGAATPEEALRYAMSLPVAATISGVDSMDVLQQNLGSRARLSAYDVGRHAGAARPVQVLRLRWPL